MIPLDTNVFSTLMQKRPDGAAVDWLDGQRPDEIWLPSVAVFELRYGVAIHPDIGRRKRLQKSLEKPMEELIQERVAPLWMASPRTRRPCWPPSARHRAVPWTYLRDTLTTGIALTCGAQLANRKTRHFQGTTISLISPPQPMSGPDLIRARLPSRPGRHHTMNQPCLRDEIAPRRQASRLRSRCSTH